MLTTGRSWFLTSEEFNAAVAVITTHHVTEVTNGKQFGSIFLPVLWVCSVFSLRVWG